MVENVSIASTELRRSMQIMKHSVLRNIVRYKYFALIYDIALMKTRYFRQNKLFLTTFLSMFTWSSYEAMKEVMKSHFTRRPNAQPAGLTCHFINGNS